MRRRQAARYFPHSSQTGQQPPGAEQTRARPLYVSGLCKRGEARLSMNDVRDACFELGLAFGTNDFIGAPVVLFWDVVLQKHTICPQFPAKTIQEIQACT